MRLPVQVQAILYRKTNTKTQYLLLKRTSTLRKFWQPITRRHRKKEKPKPNPLKREIQKETRIGITN